VIIWHRSVATIFGQSAEMRGLRGNAGYIYYRAENVHSCYVLIGSSTA
jgi:hypothetical protein